MKTLQLLILILAPIVCVVADVAPIRFDSYNISTIEATGVSMETAKVDITWGDPCRAKAVFTFMNHTEEPQNIHIGFPIRFLSIEEQDKYNYTISFNGNKAERLGRSKYKEKRAKLTFLDPANKDEALKEKEYDEVEVEWFGKILEFPIGKSEISIVYDIPLSWTYRLPYRRVIHYIVHSGSGWSGNIKKETVTIHFPNGINADQIDGRIRPKCYSLNDKSISWCFTNFEPTVNDDITVELIDFNAFSDLKEIEGYHTRYPSCRMGRLALVKHYFALGPHKGCGRWLPESFSKEELDQIFGDTKNQADKEFLEKCSKKVLDNGYQFYASEDGWQKLFRILSEVYVPRNSRSIYVDKARKVLEDHLESNPDDEYAWLIYLHNYYRFSFCGYPYGTYPKQKAVIEKAIKHCPDNDMLQRWKKTFENEKYYGSFEDDEYLIGISSGVFLSVR